MTATVNLKRQITCYCKRDIRYAELYSIPHRYFGCPECGMAVPENALHQRQARLYTQAEVIK